MLYYSNIDKNYFDSSLYINNETEIYRRDSTIYLAGNSFSDIQYAIDHANENDTIQLLYSGNYISCGSEIIINKTLTINGEGSTLDGNYSTKIFRILSDGVILKDLRLKNGCAKFTYPALYLIREGQVISSINPGGAISWEGDDGALIDCVLYGNTFNGGSGTAIGWQGKNGTILNTYLFDNYVPGSGARNNLYKFIYGSIKGDMIGNLYRDTFIINASVNKNESEVSETNESIKKIIFENYSMVYDSNKQFSIKIISNDSKPLSNISALLEIYIGKTFKAYDVKTDYNGIASFNLSGLAAGTYKFSVTADHDIFGAQETGTIKINKANTLLNINKKSFKYKKSNALKVKIINKANKKAISGLTLKVKVYTGKKYKTYNLKTNKKGQIQFNTKYLKKGNHKIVISSNNKNYNINKKFTIKVS